LFIVDIQIPVKKKPKAEKRACDDCVKDVNELKSKNQ